LPVSSLNCDRPLCSGIRAPDLISSRLTNQRLHKNNVSQDYTKTMIMSRQTDSKQRHSSVATAQHINSQVDRHILVHHSHQTVKSHTCNFVI